MNCSTRRGCRHEAGLPVGDGLELAEEEAEGGGLFDEAEAFDERAVLVEASEAVDDVLDLREREDAAGEGEAQELEVGEGAGYLAVAHAGAPFFPLGDEVDVVGEEAGVVYEHEAVLVAGAADGLHVLERVRLAADEVGAGFHADEGDMLGAVGADGGLELVDVHVAFEGVVAFDLERLVDGDFLDCAAVEDDMGLGRGEVVVHGDDLAGADEELGEDILARSALVGGGSTGCRRSRRRCARGG